MPNHVHIDDLLGPYPRNWQPSPSPSNAEPISFKSFEMADRQNEALFNAIMEDLARPLPMSGISPTNTYDEVKLSGVIDPDYHFGYCKATLVKVLLRHLGLPINH